MVLRFYQDGKNHSACYHIQWHDRPPLILNRTAHMSRSFSILMADAVGLGKTLEVGILVSEAEQHRELHEQPLEAPMTVCWAYLPLDVSLCAPAICVVHAADQAANAGRNGARPGNAGTGETHLPSILAASIVKPRESIGNLVTSFALPFKSV